MDEACKEHKIAYRDNKELEKRHTADRILKEKAQQRILAKNASLDERLASLAVSSIISLKEKAGMGVKKKRKVRKIPIAKRGGFILPALTGVATAATVIKTIKDMINSKNMVKETERHNRAMEELAKKGKGLFLSPYKKAGNGIKRKKGKGIKKKRKNKKQNFL